MAHFSYINIAEINIVLKTKIPIHISKNFREFVSTTKPLVIDCLSEIDEVEKLPEKLKKDRVGADYDNDIFLEEDGKYSRIYHKNSGREIYAMSRQDVSGIKSVVSYLIKYRNQFRDMNQCFHLIGWEQMMAWHDRMILHAACIETEYGGILYSGVTGIGKSTQASMWLQYRNARLINGDRTIIYKKNGWRASGSPFAGSSNCHINVNIALRAIIMLEKSDENVIRRLSSKEAFYSLYPMSTIYMWDKEFIGRIVDMLSAVVDEVPVYYLKCTADERAVKIVETELSKGDVKNE